jgi:hypothetical protein
MFVAVARKTLDETAKKVRASERIGVTVLRYTDRSSGRA